MRIVVLDLTSLPLEWFLLSSWVPWLWRVDALNTKLKWEEKW